MDASSIGSGSSVPTSAESGQPSKRNAASPFPRTPDLSPALQALAELIGQSGLTDASTLARGTGRIASAGTTGRAQRNVSSNRVSDVIDALLKATNLRRTLDHPTLRGAVMLPRDLVDVLLREPPHRLFLRDHQFAWWAVGNEGPAIVIDIDRPNAHGLERAQAIADITGSYVVTPNPDVTTEWATLSPRRIETELDGPVDFNARANAFHVTHADGSRSPIDPDAHLGMLLGGGGRKTALQLGDKTVVVYREETGESVLRESEDSPERAIALTGQLRSLGAPHLAKIHGITRIHGLPALVMDTYRASDRALWSRTSLAAGGGRYINVHDTTHFTHRSIASLSATRKWIIERNIAIDDLQFLVRRDGTFDLADANAVVAEEPPTRASLVTIDKLLWLARAKLAPQQ